MCQIHALFSSKKLFYALRIFVTSEKNTIDDVPLKMSRIIRDLFKIAIVLES